MIDAGIATARTDEERYARFTDRIVGAGPVETKIGPGGVSYYVTANGQRRFACHFNARPRSGASDRGFADFKPRATGLDLERVVRDLEDRLGPRVDCRRGAAWWSVHFAAADDGLVATAFRNAVIEPMLEGRDA